MENKEWGIDFRLLLTANSYQLAILADLYVFDT